MVRTTAIRKNKKKSATTNAPISNIASSAPQNSNRQSEQEDATSRSADGEMESNEEIAWTPMQLEQIELSQKLDDYISGFQKKLLRLNFQPSNRELVILFIMNLHPRWRRMVEPVELSCSSWVEAAAFARLHCARVSAMMGCENRSDAIFKTEEARTLRDSGYFAPESSPKECTVSVDHLLKPLDNDPTYVSVPTIIDTEPQEPHISSLWTADKKPTKASPKNEAEKPVSKDKTPSASEKASPSKSTSSIPEPSESTSTSVTKAQMQAKVQQAVKNRKEKEREKKAQMQLLQQMKLKPDQQGTLLDTVPKEHLNVNLTFLELPINGKTVRGLLAKMSWGSSAMSVECVHRLGLSMDANDLLSINTDFGLVDSIGILTLPIHHPADPNNTRTEMVIQVLPMIYGGKVDLVLGADFFHIYNPILNIRTRSIRFLDKETPYIVDKIVE